MNTLHIFCYLVQLVCSRKVFAKESLLYFENDTGVATGINITILVHSAENGTAKHFQDDTIKNVQCTADVIKLLQCPGMPQANKSQNPRESCRILYCQCSMDRSCNAFSKGNISHDTCMVSCCVKSNNVSIFAKDSLSDEVLNITIYLGICENIEQRQRNFDAPLNNIQCNRIQKDLTDIINFHYWASNKKYLLQLKMRMVATNLLVSNKHANCPTADEKSNSTGKVNIYVSTKAKRETRVFHDISSGACNSSWTLCGETKKDGSMNTNDLICPLGYIRQLNTCILRHNYIENTIYPSLVGDGRSVYEVEVIIEKIRLEKIGFNTNMMYEICSRLKRSLSFFQRIISTFIILNLASPIRVEDNYKTYCAKILLNNEIALFRIMVYLKSLVRRETFRFNPVKVSLQNFNNFSELHCEDDLTLIQLHSLVIQKKFLYFMSHIDSLGQTIHLAKHRYKISTSTQYEERIELITYCTATFRRLSLNCSLNSYSPDEYVADNSTVLLIKGNIRLSGTEDFDIIDGILYVCRDSMDQITTTEIQVTDFNSDEANDNLNVTTDHSVVHEEDNSILHCPVGYVKSNDTCTLKYNITNDVLSSALDKGGHDVHEVDIVFQVKDTVEYNEDAIEEFCKRILWSLKHSSSNLFEVKPDTSTIDACHDASECLCATLRILTTTRTSLILKYMQVPISFFSRYSFIQVSLQNFYNISQLYCNNDFSLVLSNTSVLKQAHNELLAEIDSSGEETLLTEQRYRLLIPHQGEARLDLLAYCLSFERLTINCPMESYNQGHYIIRNESIVIADKSFNISHSHDIINGVLYICKNTHFIFNETDNETQKNNSVLIIICTCSLAVSHVSLLTALLMHFVFQELRDLHGKVLTCFILSLLMAQTLELLNAFVIFNYPTLCKISAVILHFTWISGFAWNGVLTFDIARRFNICSRTNFKHASNQDACRFLKYCIFGWFIPLIFVAILNALEMGNVVGFLQYGYSCWISDRNITLYVSLLPIAVMLVISLVCLLIAFVGIMKSKKSPFFVSKMKPCRIRCIIYTMTTCLLSIACLFAFLTTLTHVKTFDYVVSIISGTPSPVLLLGLLVNIKNIRRTQSKRQVKTSCKYIDN